MNPSVATNRLMHESGRWELDLARRELRMGGQMVPLGDRAFEIVALLAQSSGELVTKDDLLSHVWPKVIVEENTLQVHISAIRKALGADRELLKTAAGRGYRLLGKWVLAHEGERPPAAQRESFPPDDMTDGNLPSSTTDLFGRTAALRHLRDLVTYHRIVTLTGVGGIGKTSLAIETARILSPMFDDGTWMIELAGLSSPAFVAPTIATALRLNLGGGQNSADAVARAIAKKKMLLILDNCEHVIEAAARAADTLTRLCANVSIIATSREVLQIQGEHAYRVPPIDTPREDQSDADDLLDNDAVQLFITRMNTVNFGVVSGDNDLPTIAAICRRLDGIPLAIGFAAARAATLGVQQVAARLDDRFTLLGGGRRTALPRHQTLRAALDWSYEILPSHEQRLFRLLGVFPSGFSLDAASALAGLTDGAKESAVEGLANLVAKSLAMPDNQTSTGRWRMLETVRTYSLEKLEESGEAEAAYRRRAEYFRDYLAPIVARSQLPFAREDVMKYNLELGNIRATLDWATSSVGDIMLAVSLTVACIPLWIHLSLMVECRERIERALQILGPGPDKSAPERIQLLIALARALSVTMGPSKNAKAALVAALDLAKEIDDRVAQLRCLWALWVIQIGTADSNGALETAEQFAIGASEARDAALKVVGDRLVGVARLQNGRLVEARQYLERATKGSVELGDKTHFYWFHHDQGILARAFLARSLWFLGFFDQAMSLASRSLLDAEATNDPICVCEVLRLIVCPLEIAIADLAAAERAVQRLEEIATRHNARFWLIQGKCLTGQLRIKQRNFRAGVDVLQDALDSSEEAGWSVCRSEFLATLALGLAGLGDFERALELLEQAEIAANLGGERYYLAEILRIKGELLLKTTDGARSEGTRAAARCLEQALKLAQEQSARFVELRAARSIAALRLEQSDVQSAKTILESAYLHFTEGFETRELKEALDMLQALTSLSD
jgi:predicted ATPase/DNA-binding winged helix-turn-helix (wHTH) protein